MNIISKKNIYFMIIVNVLIATVGFILMNNQMLRNATFYSIFVIAVTFSAAYDVISDKENLIRPYTYFVISFFIFIWDRVIMNLFWGYPIISVGNGINVINIQSTVFYLGASFSIISSISLLSYSFFIKHENPMYKDDIVFSFPRWVINTVLLVAIIFFCVFFFYSIKNALILEHSDYLSISTSVLLTSYKWFSIGKYFIIIYIIIDKNPKKYLIGSFILMIASCGFLITGARGYAICYFFLWLICLQTHKKIQFHWIVLTGLVIIILSSVILEYRLGKRIYSNVFIRFSNTLFSQSASIEPVFGAMTFRRQLLNVYNPKWLFFRNDFGLSIDKIRNIGFDKGGFGTSFFAETVYLGMAGIIFQIFLGIAIGYLEMGFKKVVSHIKGYGNYFLVIFLTIPNLIYIARSDIKNFLCKFIVSIIIVYFLYIISVSVKKNYVSKNI